MQTNLFVIVIQPLNSDVRKVFSTFLQVEGRVFCSCSCNLDRAMFFNSYEEAFRFKVENVLPLIDTKCFVSYVRSCLVTLNL